VRGAATAREFKLGGSGAAARVEKYGAEVAAGIVSHANRRSSGRPLGFNGAVEAGIGAVFEPSDTTTYREAARLRVSVASRSPRCTNTPPETWTTGAWAQEGKGKGGAHRVHVDASYAQLRARLGIADS